MKRLIFYAVMAFVLLISFGCKHSGTEEPSSDTEISDTQPLAIEQQAMPSETQTEKHDKMLYVDGNVFSEDHAFFSKEALYVFNVSSGKSVPYCLDPGCEHIRPKRDKFGELLTKFCMAYDLGDKAFSLRDDCSYFFSYPILYRADREGANRRIIAELDFGFPSCKAELYTKDSYFRLYICNTELLKVTDENTGVEQWVFGKMLEKQKVGIFRMGLDNGKIEEIFSADDLYDLWVQNLAEYNDHLLFTCIGLDIPYDQLPDIAEDPEAYVQAQKEHDFTRVYDYDIANSKLNLIISEQGIVGYDFVEGYIVKCLDGDDLGVLYDLSGNPLRELPFSPDRLVRSDRYVFAQDYTNEQNLYYLYDPIEDKMLKSTDIDDNQFYPLAAVGDSYYASKNGRLYYISSEDFWNGELDKAICLLAND